MMTGKKTIVVIPTYNESENIKEIIEQVLNLRVDRLAILIVDDNSPDGTAKIVQDMNRENVMVMLGKGRRGRGLAGKAGFLKALELGADYIIEMDADLSHDPVYIPLMIEYMKKYDVVLGSRLVTGSKDIGRSFGRRLLTKTSNLYTRAILRLNIKDCNSGYRCFRRKVLEDIAPGIEAEGPDIVQEVLYKCYLKGYKIKEFPIKFSERKKGESKLGFEQFMGGVKAIIRIKSMHGKGRI